MKLFKGQATRRKIRKQIKHHYALINIQRNEMEKNKGVDQFKARFMADIKIKEEERIIGILKDML